MKPPYNAERKKGISKGKNGKGRNEKYIFAPFSLVTFLSGSPLFTRTVLPIANSMKRAEERSLTVTKVRGTSSLKKWRESSCQ